MWQDPVLAICRVPTRPIWLMKTLLLDFWHAGWFWETVAHLHQRNWWWGYKNLVGLGKFFLKYPQEDCRGHYHGCLSRPVKLPVQYYRSPPDVACGMASSENSHLPYENRNIRSSGTLPPCSLCTWPSCRLCSCYGSNSCSKVGLYRISSSERSIWR